jgi:hypothetical protein
MKIRRPDGWSRIHNFYILLNACPDHANRRSGGWIWIAILALCMSASGWKTTLIGRLHQSSHKWTWKESEAWSNTKRRPDECKLEQKLLITVKGPHGNPDRPDGWCLVCLASRWYGTSSGQKEQWTDEHPDGMAQSFGRLAGNRFF